MKGKTIGIIAAASTILLSGAILISTAAISAQPVQAAEEHAAGSMQRQVEWGIAPFTSADISVELAEVSFLTAEDYGIEMVWADERIKPNYKVSNGKLTVFTPRAWSSQASQCRERTVYRVFAEDGRIGYGFSQDRPGRDTDCGQEG